MSCSNCCFLTCIQISQEASQVVWYSHLSQSFPQFIVILQSQISNDRGQAEFKKFWTIKRKTIRKEKMSEKKQKYKFWKTRSFPASSISVRIFQFLVIHTVKGFGIVNKAEIDVFLELSCFFHDPVDVGNLISGSSAFSKTSLNIWKFMVHVLLKPGLENFEHYFTSMWDECNCAVVWAFYGITFLWDWNENWPFPVLWPLLSFPNLLAYWVQHFHSIIF